MVLKPLLKLKILIFLNFYGGLKTAAKSLNILKKYDLRRLFQQLLKTTATYSTTVDLAVILKTAAKVLNDS